MNLKIAIVASALALGVAGCMTPMASAPPAVTAVSTAEFVQMATSSSTFEIESSRLALKRSKNPEVGRFAQQMIKDHTAAERRMMVAARRSGMTPPRPMLNAKHQAMLDSVASASDFDAAYVSAQLAAHQEAVSLFTAYSSSGDDPQLVQFAQATLPTLQMHLDHVQAMSGGSPRAM
jgi:putative membrane protein